MNVIDYISDKKESYSYILGIYLGDGYIDKMKRTYRLRFFNDVKYPKIIDEWIYNLQTLFPNNKVNKSVRGNTICIYVYSNKLPLLFPQHGKGLKKDRKIKLLDWQKDIIVNDKFLKGLYQSDGSYYKSGKYYFYNFRNYSKDILNIYKNVCDNLNIEYTETKNTINHYKQNVVERLHEMIGTKI